jgi:N-acetylglucosamine kinase-like BadF-type ATPase
LKKRLSTLTRELLSFYGLKNPRELVPITYSSKNPVKLIASCAKLVCETAEKNEPNAVKITYQAAESLLYLALQAKKYFDNDAVIKVTLAGEILKENSVVNKKFKDIAQKTGLNIVYSRQEMQPACAAVLHSIKKSNMLAPDSLVTQLKQITF